MGRPMCVHIIPIYIWVYGYIWEFPMTIAAEKMKGKVHGSLSIMTPCCSPPASVIWRYIGLPPDSVSITGPDEWPKVGKRSVPTRKVFDIFLSNWCDLVHRPGCCSDNGRCLYGLNFDCVTCNNAFNCTNNFFDPYLPLLLRCDLY